MKVKVQPTGDIEELKLISPISGRNIAEDYISLYPDLMAKDFQEDENGLFITSVEKLTWWKTLIEQHQALNIRIHQLEAQHGEEAVTRALNDVVIAGDYTVETEASVMMSALDLAFEIKDNVVDVASVRRGR